MQSSPISLEERALGAYIGLAVGDALGCTTEFLTPQEIRESHGVHDKICGGGWLRLKAGQVTDDTEMSLALGESIIESGVVNALLVAEAFSNWMRKKPVDIGHTVRRGIIHYRSTGQALVPENEYDAGNGACMRTLPVALRYWNAPEEQLIAASREQSHTTHHNVMADAGTETILKMIIASMQGQDMDQLRNLVDALVDAYPVYRFDRRRVENPSGYIVETLQVVWQAFFAHDNFESILVDVVNRGGDADTTGAIVGMLAGAHYGLAGIPSRWLEKLDRQVRHDCTRQTEALLSLAARGEAYPHAD
jgi:ADP-ribosyl-[dinitrogen reductase] hydrolase